MSSSMNIIILSTSQLVKNQTELRLDVDVLHAEASLEWSIFYDQVTMPYPMSYTVLVCRSCLLSLVG